MKKVIFMLSIISVFIISLSALSKDYTSDNCDFKYDAYCYGTKMVNGHTVRWCKDFKGDLYCKKD